MSTEAIRTALEALKWLLHEHERNTCRHEDTYRGGTIWTICRDCGKKWADDEGGFKAYREPRQLEQARAAISTLTAEMERPAPEPVAWMVYPAGDRMGGRSSGLWREKPTEERLTQIAENIGLPVVLAPLYAAPQKDQT